MTQEYIRVIDFKQTGKHSLLLKFSDGFSREIDFMPALKGNFLKPLRQSKFFSQVKLDKDRGTLEWPNEADFDPETLRNWPKYLKAFKNWNPVETQQHTTTNQPKPLSRLKNGKTKPSTEARARGYVS